MVNIRSLRKNFDEFNLYRLEHAKNYEIIGIVESWIKEDEAFRYKLDNYELYVQERPNERSGGVALYIRSDLSCNVQKIISDDFNALRFNISAGLNRPLTGLLVYRFCRRSLKPFFDQIESSLKDSHDSAVVFGDMNINLLEQTTCNGYLNTMFSMGFKSLINTPTRVTKTSSTCIDHFWFRGGPGQNSASNAHHELDNVPFTDHKLAKIILNWGPKNLVCQSEKILRKINWGTVKDNLAAQNWSSVLGNENVDEAFGNFLDIIKGLIDSATTETTVKNNKYNPRSPWISDSLIKLSATKNELFKLTKKFPNNNSLKTQLLDVAKKLKNQLRQEKTKYYSKRIQLCGSNSAKYWQLIKGVIQGPKHVIKSVKIEGESLPVKGNEMKSANAFNDYFVTVIQKLLAGSDSTLNRTYHPKLSRRLLNSFICSDVSPNEITEIVSKMPNKSSKGLDGIDIIFIKNHLNEILRPLVYLFSLSLNKGIFPKSFKTAIITPLLKKGNPEDISNYRPISILSTMSKILEKIVHKRLLNFLIKYGFFSPKQYGFLPGRSTDRALFDKIKEITQNLESGKHVACIYFDVAKAFDAVQHSILLDKLERLGVRGPCLHWFRSYLTNREQRVIVGGVIGDSRQLNCGVPQGSSLGPLLFLIYVNDLLQQDLGGSTYSFADDTAIVFSRDTPELLAKDVNNELRNVMDWFACHKLVPNADKTKMIKFRYSNDVQKLDSIKLHQCSDQSKDCLCPIIEQTQSIRYLGLCVDSELKWQKHAQQLQGRLRKLNYLIFHAKKFFRTTHLLRIYSAIYEPVVRYGIIHWGGMSKFSFKTLEVLQRNVVRSIAGIKVGEGSKKWFSKFQILTIQQLYDLECAVFAHRNQNLFPSPVKPIVRETRAAHESRQGKLLFKPFWIRQRSRNQSPFAIPQIYNGIPVKLKQTNNFKSFRRKYKKLILEKSLEIQTNN